MIFMGITFLIIIDNYKKQAFSQIVIKTKYFLTKHIAKQMNLEKKMYFK